MALLARKNHEKYLAELRAALECLIETASADTETDGLVTSESAFQVLSFYIRDFYSYGPNAAETMIRDLKATGNLKLPGRGRCGYQILKSGLTKADFKKLFAEPTLADRAVAMADAIGGKSTKGRGQASDLNKRPGKAALVAPKAGEPDEVDFPIPGNDDVIRTNQLAPGQVNGILHLNQSQKLAILLDALERSELENKELKARIDDLESDLDAANQRVNQLGLYELDPAVTVRFLRAVASHAPKA